MEQPFLPPVIAALLWCGPGTALSQQDPHRLTIEDWIRDLEKRPRAAPGLVRLGRRAVSQLIVALGDEQAPRLQVLQVLDRIGAQAAGALPHVATLLAQADRPDDLALQALRTVGTLAPYGTREARDRAEIIVMTFFKDKAPRSTAQRTAIPWWTSRFTVRLTAATDLSRIDPSDALAGRDLFAAEWAIEHLDRAQAADALPALETFLVKGPRRRHSGLVAGGRHGSLKIPPHAALHLRESAARAILSLAGTKPTAVPAHLWFLHYGDILGRRKAAKFLGRGGIEPRLEQQVVFSLGAALRDEDSVVVQEAMISLGILAPEAAWIRNRIQRLIVHQDPQVGAVAAATIMRLNR